MRLKALRSSGKGRSRFYRIFYVIVSMGYSRYIERDEVQEGIVAELEIVLVRWRGGEQAIVLDEWLVTARQAASVSHQAFYRARRGLGDLEAIWKRTPRTKPSIFLLGKEASRQSALTLTVRHPASPNCAARSAAQGS